MRVLVTGSSGQIGTNLALRLLADGHDVFGVDVRPNTWTDAFPYLLKDLTSPLGDELPRADVVVHLAAHAKVHQLVRLPHRALENTVMTFNVLDHCRRQRIPVVFSSSREVYGDVHRFEGYDEGTADFAFTESTYSASKIAGEAFVYSFARCYGLPYLVFRFSNVYGRFDNDIERMERVIPLFIRKIKRQEPIVIYGKDKILDFTYIDDCVDGIVKGIDYLMTGKGENHVINLAYGQGSSLVTMADYIGEALNIKPVLTFQPPRLGEVTRYVANIGKARALLGYSPQTSLQEGIYRTVAWSEEWEQKANRKRELSP